ISYVLSQFRLSDVSDGTTHTAMVGEKYMPRQHYRTGRAFGDDHPTFIGDDADNRRWADKPPRGDASDDDISHFGSAHAASCHFISCDGAVRTINYGIDSATFQCFGNRHDRKQINLNN